MLTSGRFVSLAGVTCQLYPFRSAASDGLADLRVPHPAWCP